MENVLLALVGMSPAVLTETVWALVVDKNVIPDKIVVLTTTEGQAKIEKELLNSGVWKNMEKALGKKLKFGKASIKVFPSKDEGDYLSDINTLEENEAAADCIMENIRFWSDKPETTIWASLAGGRKTMSALMMSCMSLLGRGDDKVLHVLVKSPYDGPLDPPFFFPEKDKEHITRDGKTIKSSKAKINLIEVPFVKMKGWYSDKYKNEKKNMPTYKELVEMVQESVFPKIVIDYENASLIVNGDKIYLKVPEFAVLALKVGNGIANLQEIQARLKIIVDEVKCIYKELNTKTKKGKIDIDKKLKESGITLWEYAKINGISPKIFNQQTPGWVKDIIKTAEDNIFSSIKAEDVTPRMNALRDKLRKYLPDNLEKLCPKGKKPVDYPKNKIEERGKNPFSVIFERIKQNEKEKMKKKTL